MQLVAKMIMMIPILNYKSSSKRPTKCQWQLRLPLLCSLLFFVNFITFANITQISSIATASKIAQDDKGFIWLASQQGLTRFDGEQSINFSSINVAWPIPFNWIHDISLENEHILLATETDGIWRFDPNTGQASKVLTDIERKSVYDIIRFQNSYFINAPDKLYRYDLNTTVTSIIDNNIKIHELVKSTKHLYISASDGLYRLEGNGLINILKQPISTLISMQEGVVAITKTSITRFNDDGSKTRVLLSNSIDESAKEFNRDNFFTVNNQGIVNKFSGSTLQSIPHKYDNIEPIRVVSLLHDNSGVLWLVSNRGVEQRSQKTIINTPKTFDININANNIAIFKNEIVMGAYGAGLQNFITDIFRPQVNDAFTKKGLKITDIKSINGELYIGTFDGLWRFNAAEHSVEKLAFPDNNKLILRLKHHENKLYIGTNYFGVYVYNLETSTIDKHIAPELGLSSTEIIDMLPLNNGYLWLATTSTIDIVNTHTNEVRSLNLLGKSKVISLVMADNKVFASTLGDGIYALNLQGEVLAQFGQGVRYSYMKVVDGEVWVPARPGLYKFKPENYQMSMIENTGKYFFAGSTELHNNVIYSSHYAGVLSVDLSPQEKFDSKVYITKTTVSGESYLLNKAINISSGNDVITLDLASLDYRPGVKKQYSYTLNGNTWHNINGNQLTLTGLASGDYYIEIMATNSLGQWSNFKAYTQISVAYPWYWTPQIRLVYVVSALSIILLVAWLLYLRSKSISHIHNILQSDINNYGKSSMQVKRNLTAALAMIDENKISQGKLLLQQCVDDLNKRSNNSEPNALNGNSLTEAVPFLAQYLQHKYQVKLIYQFEMDENALDYELQADLYRVIFEAITSAILSGKGRSFKVVLQNFKSKIWLNISDDNQSFIHFKSKVNFDISMYYIRQIANKHHGSINTFNEQGDGSQLVLSIPVLHRD